MLLPSQFCEEHDNTVRSEDIWKKIKGDAHRDSLPKEKGEILKYMFSEEGPVAKGEVRQALLLFAGAASGKSTLLQHWPKMQTCRTDAGVFVDESASGHHEKYVNEYIPFMLGKGVNITVNYIACPVMEAYDRNALRPSPYTKTEFLSKHKRAQRGYMGVYEKFGNPTDGIPMFFEGIVNPRTAQEKSQKNNAPILFEHLREVRDDDTYSVIRRESLLAFGNDKSQERFLKKFGLESLALLSG